MVGKAAAVVGESEEVSPVVVEKPQNGLRVMLTRDMILTAKDIVTEEVDVPEWGGTILVRALSGAQRDAFDRSLIEVRGKKSEVIWANVRAKLVVRSCVDSEGNRIFTDADAVSLGRKSAAPLDRVFKVAQRLSGLTDEDVEELAEALKDDPNDDSGSDSP